MLCPHCKKSFKILRTESIRTLVGGLDHLGFGAGEIQAALARKGYTISQSSIRRILKSLNPDKVLPGQLSLISEHAL